MLITNTDAWAIRIYEGMLRGSERHIKLFRLILKYNSMWTVIYK